jgi:hypothetical protein
MNEGRCAGRMNESRCADSVNECSFADSMTEVIPYIWTGLNTVVQHRNKGSLQITLNDKNMSEVNLRDNFNFVFSWCRGEDEDSCTDSPWGIWTLYSFP